MHNEMMICSSLNLFVVENVERNQWQQHVKESIKAVANERPGPFQGHSEDRMSTQVQF